MDRLELGIFGMFVATILIMGALFVQVWDLPEAIRKDAAQAYNAHKGE